MDLEKAISSTLVFNCSDWRYIHLALLYLNMNRAIEHTSREEFSKNATTIESKRIDAQIFQITSEIIAKKQDAEKNRSSDRPGCSRIIYIIRVFSLCSKEPTYICTQQSD